MELSKLYVVEHNDEYKLTTENTGYSLEKYIEDMGGDSYYYTPNMLKLFYHKLEVGMYHCTPVLIEEFEERINKDMVNDLLEAKIDLHDTLEEVLHEVAIDLMQQEFAYILKESKSVKKKWD